MQGVCVSGDVDRTLLPHSQVVVLLEKILILEFNLLDYLAEDFLQWKM